MACGCPSSNVTMLSPCAAANAPAGLAGPAAASGEPGAARASNLSHWPIQLRLIPPDAPFLRGASLLLAADCVPASFPGYNDFLAGRAVAVPPMLWRGWPSMRNWTPVTSERLVREFTIE